MKSNTLTWFLPSVLSIGARVGFCSPLECNKISSQEELEPKYFKDLGATRIKVRYGPYIAPSRDDPETMGMKDFVGSIEPPCEDCYITQYLGGLELPDGSSANAHVGLLLHHTAIFSTARNNTACEDQPDRVFASGNERMPMEFSAQGKVKSGYLITEGEKWRSNIELMNEAPFEQEVYVTAEWEFLPGSTKGFRESRTLWLDITGVCGDVYYPVPDEAIFEAELSPAWKSTFNGRIISSTGHLHDGGTHQEFIINDEIICDQIAIYGESSEYITHVGMFDEGYEEDGHSHGSEEDDHSHGSEEEDHGHGSEEDGHSHGGEDDHDDEGENEDHDEDEDHSHEGEGEDDHPHRRHKKRQHDHGTGAHVAHISSIENCYPNKRVSKGDRLSIKSYYDSTLYPTMDDHHGGKEPVMGIALAIFVKDEDEE